MKKIPFKSKVMAAPKHIRRVQIPEAAVKILREIHQKVQLYAYHMKEVEKLRGCDIQLQSTAQGIMMGLGIKNAILNLKEMVFEVKEEPTEKKE